MPGNLAKPPVIVAAAVIIAHGRVLLTRRLEGAHLAGLWEFPGGKVEAGEDPATAVVRECQEECEIAIRVVDVMDVTFHAYANKDVLLIFYECRLSNISEDDPVQHVGVADHVWALPDELDQYPLPPPDARVLAKIKDRYARAGDAV